MEENSRKSIEPDSIITINISDEEGLDVSARREDSVEENSRKSTEPDSIDSSSSSSSESDSDLEEVR